jgi:succinate dehydrogenase / fumarate reductase cytochrome b subunit
MNRIVRLWGSSVGRKLIAGATGVLLLGFLTGHLYGNMKIFQGPEALNAYAAWLRGHPLLWVFRIGLTVAFGTHIYVTLSLARANRAARPTHYQRWSPQAAGIASRSMAVSGLIVLAFLVYHLLHFTFGVVDPGARSVAAGQGLDVYGMVVRSFQDPWITLSYVVAMLLLGVHLVHGTVSMFQTFSVHHESYETLIRVACFVIVAAIIAGNCSIPILVYLGRVGLPGG